MPDSFQIKFGPSQRICQNQLSHAILSHIEQECQGSLIQGTVIQGDFDLDLALQKTKYY